MKVPFFTMFDDLLLIVRHLLGAVGQPVMRQRWEEGGEEVRCLVPLHDDCLRVSFMISLVIACVVRISRPVSILCLPCNSLARWLLMGYCVMQRR